MRYSEYVVSLIFLLLLGLSSFIHSYTEEWVINYAGTKATISSPAIGDVNGDGRNEVVIGSGTGEIYVLSGSGDLIPGFPVDVGSGIQSSPVLVNLDADSALEIVFGCDDGRLYAFNGNGSIVSGFPVSAKDAIIATPSAIDLDKDGRTDIIVPACDGKLYAWSSSGSLLLGFPFEITKPDIPRIESSPAVGDVDGDGNIEIAFGADDGRLYYCRYASSVVSIVWSRKTGYSIRSSPAIGDVDGDGLYEIVVGSDDYSVYAFELSGMPVKGFPVTTGYKLRYVSPALADVDNDTVVEIIIASGDGKLYVIDGDGTFLPPFPVLLSSKVLFSSPVVSDIDSDGRLDIVVGCDDGKVYAVSSDGSTLPGFPYVIGGPATCSPAIGNIDADSNLEMVIGAKIGEIYCVDVGGIEARSNMPWPQFKKDNWRASVFGFVGGVAELPSVTVSDINIEVSGDITINYVLTDKQGDYLSINPMFSDDAGKTWKNANVIGRLDSIGPSEYKGSLLWKSRDDLKGPLELKGETDPELIAEERREYREQKDVKFKIIPSDSSGVGTSGETILFHVDNNNPPSIIIQNIEGEQTEDVVFNYTISDEELDLVNLKFEYSIDGGNTFKPANVSGASSSIRPARYTGQCTWDSRADCSGVDSENVIFRITPSDLDPGSPGLSNKFHLDNNAPPKVLVEDILEEVSGDISIAYKLTDKEGDKLSVDCFYSLDSGENFSKATIDGPTTGIGQTEYDGKIIWKSLADTKGIDLRTVQFKIVPKDNDEGTMDTTSNFHLDNNSPPHIEIAQVIGEQTGEFPVSFRISDDEGDEVSLLCEYSKDNGATWVNATVSGRLSSIKRDNYSGEVMWDSTIDLLGVDSAEVLFRITPSDADLGESTVSGKIYVDNNKPPSILLSDFTDEQSGDIEVHFTVSDLERDTIVISCDYSIDGGTNWSKATVSGTTRFGEEGYIGHITWNSVRDVPAQYLDRVRFRITPSDNDLGEAGTTNNFVVDNDEPPSIIVLGVKGEQTGDVVFPYEVSDREGDPVSLFVEYSVDGDDNYYPATVTGSISNITRDGYRGTLTWESGRDIKGVDSQNVLVRIIPADLDEGSAGVSPSIWIDNNLPPTVTLSSVIGEQSGDVVIDFSIDDIESDPISLICEYSEDGGINYKPAIVEGFIEEIDSTGYLGSIVWISDKNLPGTDQLDIKFRITPKDNDIGTPGETENFHLDNNELPSIIVEDITAEQSGNVSISYRLQDPEYDANMIKVDYSADGGFSWQPATVATKTEIDPTRYAGVVIWTSETDLPAIDSYDIMVRITPFDNDEGFPDETNPFHLDNNEPPIAKVEPITEEVSDDVRISFSLEDGDGDILSIDAEYSIDGGINFKNATITGDTSNLKSPYSGYIIWNSSLDILGIDSKNAVFRIIPSDNDPGKPGESNKFHIDNNTPPISFVTDIPDETSGNIKIEYSLQDDENDTISIDCYYSIDGGSSFKKATVSGVIKDITQLGYEGSVIWNSNSDIKGLDKNDVLFKVVASDNDVSDKVNPGVVYVDNNVPPKVVVSAPQGEVSGVVKVPIKISDDEDDEIKLECEFSTDGGKTFQPAEVISPTGRIHTSEYSTSIEWNYGMDMDGLDVEDVVFKVVPSDGDDGEPSLSPPFHVDNNKPPYVSIANITEKVSGNIIIDYTVEDDENDDVSLNVEYSDDGRTWKNATVSGNLNNITSLMFAGSFTWQSEKDIPYKDLSTVSLRLTPKDKDVGEPYVSSAIHVDNNLPPKVTMTVPGGRLSGDVNIPYSISDNEGDTVSLRMEYSRDGGVTYILATIKGQVSGITQARYSGTIVWDSMADLAGVNSGDIKLKLIAIDSDEGEPFESGLITIFNNQPPILTLGTPSVSPTGDITIPYSLSDAEGDIISFVCEYSIDNGVTFKVASIMGLTTDISPKEYSGELIWAAGGDLPGKELTNVLFRITPYDTNAGKTSTVVVGKLDTNIPPTLEVMEPLEEVSGDVEISYSIFDPEEDSVDLDVDFSVDGGITFKKATISSGNKGIGSSGYLGRFVWNTKTDLGNKEYDSVILRVVPKDNKPGSEVITTAFPVDNNNPPKVSIKSYVMNEDGSELTIEFIIQDEEKDKVSIDCQFSEDGGGSWSIANVVGETVGLVPDGTYRILWKKSDDIPTVVAGSKIVFRIIPKDYDIGTPSEAGL
ncbi:MAG: FG-GAP-like repeat-containing protein [bacterium]